jgi:hypothetical protein
MRSLLFLLSLLGIAAFLQPKTADAQSVYRTVPVPLRTKGDQIIPPHDFPPPDSESRQWACLVSMDAIHRKGVLRLESRDRMIDFELHPAAPIFYRGAPAALRDIPPGTMVEVWGYGDEATQLPRHVLRMSDSFSVQAFQQRGFRVESIDAAKKTFQAVSVPQTKSNPSSYEPRWTVGSSIASPFEETPITFSFNDQTSWYLGDRIVTASDLAVGQTIQANFIRKFYEGPPLITRCTEVWLDESSQSLATLKQYERFQSYLRDRGFPLRVDEVDDVKKTITVTLLETGWNDVATEWKVDQVHDFAAATTALGMWEPNGGQSVPDRMFGVKIIDRKELPIGYGCGGLQMTFSVPRLYEAYRKGSIIKLYPAGHPVPVLPIEERMPKEFDTFLRP